MATSTTPVLTLSSDKQYQNQWDAFFKVLAPHSSVIKGLAEQAFELPSPLVHLQPLTTDLASRRVAEALHLDKAYKELRPDGVFWSNRFNPLLGFEYQSTHNIGMPIRAFIYQEAVEENIGRGMPEDGMRFVILYTGQDAPKKFRMNEHLKVRTKEVSYLYVDLDQIDPALLEQDGIYSFILRLSRKDATDFSMFEQAYADIQELSDADERHRLMAALVMASMNKFGFGQRILEFEMDADIRENLKTMLPIVEELRIADEKRKALRGYVTLGQGPASLLQRIKHAGLAELSDIYDQVFEAATSRDWSSFENDYNDGFNRGPGG